MKRFLTALLLVAANFFVMPPVDAEIQTYTGTDEYIVGEHETHEVAKNNSKIRAMRNAQDQAGVFIRSRSRMKDLELVDDEVVTLTEGILKVVGAPIHEIRLLGDGKGILIHTTITVEIDTDDLDRRLSEIARVHGTNKPPIDRPKPLEAPEPEKISPPTPAVDNIALSNRKVEEAVKLCNKRNWNDALLICEDAIRLNPNNANAYETLAWTCNALERFNDAIYALNKALELNPNSGVANERLAMSYIGLREYDKAMTYCNKAMKVDPDWIWAYSARGVVYDRFGNHKQAIVDYNKVIQAVPDAAWVYNSRGWAYRNLKEPHNAINDFKKAIELETDNANHYDGLVCVYNDLGEHNKAISVLNHALQLDPNNRYVLEKLGAAYMCLKQYRQAISYCDKSIKINPNDPNYPWAYVTRGKCYEALGEHEKARADFAKARQLGWKG